VPKRKASLSFRARQCALASCAWSDVRAMTRDRGISSHCVVRAVGWNRAMSSPETTKTSRPCSPSAIPALLPTSSNSTVLARTGGRCALPIIQAQAGQQDEPKGAYFSCRRFYTLYGPQPRGISMGLGCPHWFPRSLCELIRASWPFMRKMLCVATGEESTTRPPTGFMPAAQVSHRRWWRQLLHEFHP
jgi:hypothetical protein